MNGHDIYLADDWILLRDLEPAAIWRLTAAADTQVEWQEIVPGIDSLALKYDPLVLDLEAARMLAVQLYDRADTVTPQLAKPITLSICYDLQFGPDQALVATHLGIEIADLPDWHMAQDYHVAMLGFLPGFAYLQSAAEIVDIPRLDAPRACIAAGSVGLLGQQCGLYPVEGPGGWPVIGRIAASLFDTGKTPPALLSPGQKVSFRAISRAEFNALDAP
ncbi:carboxyltransferase domain-containing protein [Sphingorhabdus sp. Alg239-R122]|uniref:5-oxoprolinase subunit B family protein n=1 Tax=Sphingorhabdus sp. Alg239-R122 TaxID=2305989 RepID=UPI0013DA3B3D|nr:carboxyltransferase domain-containing protein [Sphingorhabdus sp. Alg239-R122]